MPKNYLTLMPLNKLRKFQWRLVGGQKLKSNTPSKVTNYHQKPQYLQFSKTDTLNSNKNKCCFNFLFFLGKVIGNIQTEFL